MSIQKRIIVYDQGYQKILGSLVNRVTISSRFLTDSNTLSSKTVVNSCSIWVKSTVRFRESRFNYFLRSWPKLNWSSLGMNSLWYNILRILVSIWNWWKKYLTSLKVLSIVKFLLEVAGDFGGISASEFFKHFIVVVVFGVTYVDRIFVADTESSS